jgi:hypothetical protein
VLRSLHEEIERVLVPGGLLLTAPTDPLVETRSLERDRGSAPSIYRKGPPPAVSAPGRPPSAMMLREARRPSPASDASVAPPSRPTLARALDLADRGMLDDALRLVEDAVREEPASTPARIARARILLGMGRPEAAAVDLRAALFAVSDDPMARYLYAAALFDLGRHRQGLAQLRGALRAVEARARDLGRRLCMLRGGASVDVPARRRRGRVALGLRNAHPIARRNVPRLGDVVRSGGRCRRGERDPRRRSHRARCGLSMR